LTPDISVTKVVLSNKTTLLCNHLFHITIETGTAIDINGNCTD
jgi:hypothetical protein